MFGSFFNMLYPAKKFLTSVLNILKYNPSTYDVDELTEQMNEKEECELLNGSLNIDELNKKLKLKNFYIGDFLIKKTVFVFKRNYMGEKTILSFEDITIDIKYKNVVEEDEENKDNKGEEKSKSEGGLLDNIINIVIHNVEVKFKNIKIRFFDKENKNVEYAFFINNLEFKDSQNILQSIQPSEKIKYLFLHNKAVYIEGILFKEKYDEKDDIFFSAKEEDNETKNQFILNNNNLVYIKNKIEIDLYHDKDNNILNVGNNNVSDFYIENIFNAEQLNSLFHYFIPKDQQDKNTEINDKDNNKDKDNNNININIDKTNESNNQAEDNKNSNNIEKKEEKKGFNLMGFTINKINLDMKMCLFYFVLLENYKNEEEKKDKNWVSLQDNLIKNDDELNDKNISKTLIDHFNYFQKKYYILSINNLLFKLSNKHTSINEICLKYIGPKNTEKNDINENEYNDIININKFNFDLETKELLYDNIYIKISPDFIYLLKKYFGLSKNKKTKKKNVGNNNLKIEKNPQNENEKENEAIIDNKNENENIINTDSNNNKKNLFSINGEKLNIKIYIDKNIEDNIIDVITINNIFENKIDQDYIDFTLINFNLKKEENTQILYDLISLTYNNTENKSYPLLKLYYHENNPQFKSNNIINNQNELSIDLHFQILLFIYSKLTKNILEYIKFILKIFKKKENNNINDNNIDYISLKEELPELQELQEQEIKKKTFDFKLKGIKIYLIEEEKNYYEIEKKLSDLPENKIEYNYNNNYLCINLTEIGFKMEDNQINKKINMYLKSFIIEDDIINSKYKILLSNYYIKNKNEIFMNCDIDIKNNKNKYEIQPRIKICSIAIYLDQVKLYYLFNIFEEIKGKKEDKNEKKPKPNNKYIFKNISIEEFFIQINYNNNEVKDPQFLSKKIIILLNNCPLTDLKIIFKEYKNENELCLKDAIKDIYEYYINDIIAPKSYVPFIQALPIINHFASIMDGMLDIVREPIQSYKEKKSLADGFVQGVSNLVVNTTTIFTYFGESLTNKFNFFKCVENKDEKNDNTCRQLRYMINKNNKEIEDYYFK